MKTKEEIIDRLKTNRKDIQAIIKDKEAWDMYEDENWENLVESFNETIKYLQQKIK